MNTTIRWDVFISHASEDKESFVRPLAIALRSFGVSVWYDEFSLHIGDSLSRSIDKGLVHSRFGIVVISPHFIRKPWPEYELRGLVSREIEEDRVILPIWHGVTRSQVLKFSPPLADKVALNTEDLRAEDLAIKVLREVRPDIYSQHPRARLEKIASGEALEELQEELNHIRGDLEQYQCPYCNALLSSRDDAPVDPEQKHWAEIEDFECGYRHFGGDIQQPCPADPRFPKFEDFEISCKQRLGAWFCKATGKTDMARRVYLIDGYGTTKEEAEQKVKEYYERYFQRVGPKGRR